MNRMLLISTALLGGMMPLAVDSALKGAVLLLVAALAALSMRRSSAAARHLVWLIAVAALLVVPLLTISLPQWRVLPDWAASPVRKAVADTEQASGPLPRAFEPADLPIQREQPVTVPAPAPAPVLPSPLPVAGDGPQVVAREASLPTKPAPGIARSGWLGLGWLLGFLLLSLRLLASQVMLHRAARSCRTLGAVEDQRLLALFNETRGQLGVRQPVRLMIDPKRTIPLVWGVFRPRLMVPAEARGWSDSALRSVLLHELAHLKRRDTAVQWLAQIACALHWWNPLVWLAAWRLHVEREKACDDLVLASGVQPSSYAEHLLHVATRLAPARWGSACGLAMARKSSLEGRLVAVLSERPNRRSVTRVLVATALLLGTGISIPVAMLRAADEKPRDGVEYKTDKGCAWVRNESGKTAYIIFAPFQWNLRVSGYHLSNVKEWNESCEITLPGGEVADLRVENPAPKELTYRKQTYDFAKGRVFLLTESGSLWQLDLPVPVVTDQESAKNLAALIAAIPPQEREDITPNHEDARALYEIWQRHARANGNIPGGLIGELAAAVRVFIGYNPTWETVPKLNEILPRLDASRDWTPADAIALLEEVAAVQDSPLQAAAEKLTAAIIRKGKTLPEKYKDVAWGEVRRLPVETFYRETILGSGLRAAWVLEPSGVEHRIGEALTARLLVQNTGGAPIVVRVPTFHQGSVAAIDAKGAEVEVSGIEWTTLPRLVPVRLEMGEFIEINTPGVGLGKDAGRGPWAGPRVGSHVLVNDGTEVTLTHGPLALDGSGVGMREDSPHLVGPGWWLAHIKARLSRELPLPADAAEREHLLERVTRELFTTESTANEIAAFTADRTDGALDALAKHLAGRADAFEFAGSLATAPVKFRILPADSASDKTPRVVLGPGEYPVGAGATLAIAGRPEGDRTVADAELRFPSSGYAPAPHKINLPDGWGTWAIVCRPSDGFLYVLHKGTAWKIDYSSPSKVTDTPADNLPAELRDEVKRQFDIAGVPAESQAEVLGKPALPAAATEPKTSAVVPEKVQPIADGKSSALVLRADGQEPVVIVTGRALAASPDSTHREGTVTMNVATTANTQKIRYTWPADAPGFFEVKTGDYPVSRFDLSRGRVFFVHFEKLEFSADVFQVPAAVKVPAITSPETLTQAAAAVNSWYDAADDNARWECSRVVVAEGEYKFGQPLDAAAERIVWGKANEAGLRLGLGGLDPVASYPVGQTVPVKQYVRNDGTKTLTFSPTQIFNEGIGGELIRTSDGKKFPHQKGYPHQGFFDRCKLAPGHYIVLESGPMATIKADSGGTIGMMSHGFTVPPGEYTLQLTHGIGQCIGRPVNFNFGDPRSAPGLGEWTGVLTSAKVPLRLAEEQIETAKAGDHQDFGTRYTIAFDKGVLKLRHYNGYPNMSQTGGPWEANSRDWRVPAADGEYTAAWSVGGQGLWIKDTTGITHLIVKDVLTENGRWTPEQAAGEIKSMPAGVRTALQLPAATEPESQKEGAAAHTAPAGEFAFITSDGPLPAEPFATGDGVTLEIKRITFPPGEKRATTPPGGKPATPSGVYAILRWPARDGQPALEQGEQIVSDTVESPGKWAAAWQPGTKTVWLAAKDPAQSRPGFMEMSFPDSKQITVKHISVNLKDSLLPPSMPAGVRAKFGPFLGIAGPSGTGQPEYYESQEVHVAVQVDKKLHPGAALGSERLTDTGSAEWSVKFEHGDTEKPVTEVLARLTIIDADGSKRQTLLRTWKAGEPFHINFGADGVLRVVLTGTQYASIVVENDTPGDGGVPVSYFGNVPDSVNAGVKHTKLEEPLVVKVNGGGKTAGKLTPESLLGTWRGTVNGEKLMLSFHRPPAEKDVQLDIYFGAATIGALADFTIEADGRSVEVVQHSSGGGMKFGTLIPVEEGKLKLELFGRQKGQQELMLTREANPGIADVDAKDPGFDMITGQFTLPGFGQATETAATGPRQKEARELFELWKATANPDGTIPGTFIGMLATEVRAYVKANPTLDSAAKLPKLLPSFATSRDWTQAESIKLLDDVAYYAIEPIVARVAKAKLGSGPLWRTMVEFQDIPVQIAKWSEAKDGLRIGMRVVDGQWSTGGSVRVELWLHNAGNKDVSFRTAGPNRQDVEVSVTAIDAEGNEHRPKMIPVNLIAPLMDCTLPAGHVAMAKETTVTFAADNGLVNPIGHRLLDLKPGNYQLRSTLMLAKPEPAKSGEYSELTAPDFPFTLGEVAAEVDWRPQPILVPDAVQGGPRAEDKPERSQFSNDKYSAVAFQSEKDVNFVLIYEGALSTGLGETWSDTTKRWSIEGHVHLVDPGKTQAAGRNVDKRKVAVKYTSDEPKKLYLDGKGYDLAAPLQSVGAGWLQMSGRVFILRDEGEPIQTGRTLALRDQKDLVTLGDFAAHDRFMAETYADNRRVLAMEGWALAWDTQEPIQHGSGEYVAQTRIFPDGRVLSLTNGRELKEFKITPAELAELTGWLVEEQRIGEWKPAKVRIANTGQEMEMSPVKNMWDRQTDLLIFTRDGKRHGVAAEHGATGTVDFAPIRERLWALAKKAGDAKPAGGE